MNAKTRTSEYLQYLPTPYRKDPIIQSLVQIAESILGPIEGTIDQLAAYFDPSLTPAELLPWLASWVGRELDENWPIEKQRALVQRAAELYRWRGTRRGLREHLAIFTGELPLIVENVDGFRLEQDAALGLDTYLGEPRDNCVFVWADPHCESSEAVLRQIVEETKPAHAAYKIEFWPPEAAGGDGQANRVATVEVRAWFQLTQ